MANHKKSESAKEQPERPAPNDKTGWKSPMLQLRAIILAICLTYIPYYWYQKIGYGRNEDYHRSYVGEKVRWRHCGHITNHDLECATINVPMDQFHATRSNKTFEIPIIRMRGHDAQEGQNLLLNPGGPGNSGVKFLEKVGEQLNIMVGEGYHLVSFDPRGVNGSRPQALCYPNAEARRDRSPHRDRDIVQDSPDVYAWAQNFAQACADTTGEHGAYINTPQTAADMNTILDVLGQEKLTYWGFSYGTLLGQTYAMLFPDRVGSMIIDGVANVFEYYISEPRMEMMTDTEMVFDGFLNECAKAGKACSLNELATSKDGLRKKVDKLGEQLKKEPMSVYVNNTHYGTLDWNTVWYEAVFKTLYVPLEWYSMADQLSKLLQGNATDFFLAHGMRDMDSPGSDAFAFIMFNDGYTGPEYWPQNREDLLEIILPKLRSSLFAATINERFYQKQQWRIPSTHDFLPRQGIKTSPPLLILSQTYDPVTPLKSAMSARKAFEGSRLVEIQGYGHCSIASPSACTLDHIRRFLHNGTLPEHDTTCEVDGPFFVVPGDENAGIPEDIAGDPHKLHVYRAQRQLVKNFLG